MLWRWVEGLNLENGLIRGGNDESIAVSKSARPAKTQQAKPARAPPTPTEEIQHRSTEALSVVPRAGQGAANSSGSTGGFWKPSGMPVSEKRPPAVSGAKGVAGVTCEGIVAI